MAATGSRNDPYSSFSFLVEIDGVTVAGFSEAAGLSTATDIIEYRNGNETNTVRKLPGLKKFTNITLKRGMTDSRELWDWRRTVEDGRTERQSGSIVLRNEAQEEALRWNFREAWPTKLDAPSFNAKNNETALESIELAVEDLRLA